MTTRSSALLIILTAGLISFIFPKSLVAQHPITFEILYLTVDSNEGCDIADLDGDGKLDVVAGRNWYSNSDWTPRPLRIIEDKSGYVRSNGDWAFDVNGDNRPDIISMDFFSGEVSWYENPGEPKLRQGHLWNQHLLADIESKTNEISFLLDINKDGTPEWIANQWNRKQPFVFWEFSESDSSTEISSANGKSKKGSIDKALTMVRRAIGDINGHGIGFGDINNDGKDDVLFAQGWYESPQDGSLDKPWKLHSDWTIPNAPCPMLIYDVNGDGLNDVITGKAHDFGLELWKSHGVDQAGALQFEKSTIDESFSQPHCLHLADLDGDGVNEVITGKRVYAHNGKDPGGKEPPVIKYFVWNSETNTFVNHIINRGYVGTGLQIRTADLDQDGDVDIVVAGKDGTQILFNQLSD